MRTYKLPISNETTNDVDKYLDSWNLLTYPFLKLLGEDWMRVGFDPDIVFEKRELVTFDGNTRSRTIDRLSISPEAIQTILQNIR